MMCGVVKSDQVVISCLASSALMRQPESGAVCQDREQFAAWVEVTEEHDWRFVRLSDRGGDSLPAGRRSSPTAVHTPRRSSGGFRHRRKIHCRIRRAAHASGIASARHPRRVQGSSRPDRRRFADGGKRSRAIRSPHQRTRPYGSVGSTRARQNAVNRNCVDWSLSV